MEATVVTRTCFMQKLHFLMKSKRQNSGPPLRLAEVPLIEWSLGDKMLRGYCRRSVIGFGSVAAWKPLTG